MVHQCKTLVVFSRAWQILHPLTPASPQHCFQLIQTCSQTPNRAPHFSWLTPALQLERVFSPSSKDSAGYLCFSFCLCVSDTGLVCDCVNFESSCVRDPYFCVSTLTSIKSFKFGMRDIVPNWRNPTNSNPYKLIHLLVHSLNSCILFLTHSEPIHPQPMYLTNSHNQFMHAYHKPTRPNLSFRQSTLETIIPPPKTHSLTQPATHSSVTHPSIRSPVP